MQTNTKLNTKERQLLKRHLKTLKERQYSFKSHLPLESKLIENNAESICVALTNLVDSVIMTMYSRLDDEWQFLYKDKIDNIIDDIHDDEFIVRTKLELLYRVPEDSEVNRKIFRKLQRMNKHYADMIENLLEDVG